MKKYVLPTMLFATCYLVSCKKEDPASLVNATEATTTNAGTTAHRSSPSPSSVSLGNLPDYLMVFTNGSSDANWQGATKGFCGNMFVNGNVAHERTSGNVPFGGVLSTSKDQLAAWQGIIDDNVSQSSVSTSQGSKMAELTQDLTLAMTQINGLTVSAGYSNVSASSLNGLNTMNGIGETIVINITSGMSVNSQINITGDANDTYILRWDSDANPANGYQGKAKFQSGGAIVPHGDLIATNFINVAGDIGSSGGGSNPAYPYPQGPRYNNGTGALVNGGANFNGGGFFTGYWLTTGDPNTGNTSSLSNAIFVGGWFTTSTSISMTSGTSGVHVNKPQSLPEYN